MTRPVIRPATSHRRDWDPGRPAEEKKRRGIRVSLVLPARDEVATVGGIVARLRQEHDRLSGYQRSERDGGEPGVAAC